MSLSKRVKIQGPTGLQYNFDVSAKNGRIIQSYVWAFTTNIFNVATNQTTEECISALTVISKPATMRNYYLEWLPLIWIDNEPVIVDIMPKCFQLVPPIRLNPDYDDDVMFVMPPQQNAQVRAVNYSAVNFNLKAMPMTRSAVRNEIPIVLNQFGTGYDWYCSLPKMSFAHDPAQSRIYALKNSVRLNIARNRKPNIERVEGGPVTEDTADIASGSNATSDHPTEAEDEVSNQNQVDGTAPPAVYVEHQVEDIPDEEVANQHVMGGISEPVEYPQMGVLENQETIADMPEAYETETVVVTSGTQQDCTETNESSSDSGAECHANPTKFMLTSRRYKTVRIQCNAPICNKFVKICCATCSNPNEAAGEINSIPRTPRRFNAQEFPVAENIDGKLVIQDDNGLLQNLGIQFDTNDNVDEVVPRPDMTVKVDTDQCRKWVIFE